MERETLSANLKFDVLGLHNSSDAPILQSHMPTATIRAGLSSPQKSLLCELELKAEWQGSALEFARVKVAPGLNAALYWFDRRLGRVRTGVSDAVVVLPHGVDCFDAEALATQIAATIRADLATVRVVGAISLSARPHVQLQHVSADHGYRSKILTEYRDIRQVLSLETTVEAFLTKLGRSTRRNVDNCRQHAVRLGMRFRYVLGGQAVDATALSAIAQQNMPKPTQPHKLAGVNSLIARQSLPFHASLTRDDGQLVSVAGGFIDGPLACLLYQCNRRADRDLGPSLMMRLLLIERLISDRIREIAFVGGCSGVLVHSCDRVRAADMLVVQTSLNGLAKHWLAQTFDPRGRVARLSERMRQQGVV